MVKPLVYFVAISIPFCSHTIEKSSKPLEKKFPSAPTLICVLTLIKFWSDNTGIMYYNCSRHYANFPSI